MGKLGNIDHLEPGMISVVDTLNPVTGTPLTYRAAATYNNSWNWNLHYRAAVSYITGSHAFKVGFNNAYLHHDNTTYSAPAMPFSYNFTSMVPTAITYRIVPRTVEVNVNRDMGLFVQDKWTTGRWTLAGALRFDSFKNRFPEQAIAGTFFGRNLNVYVPEDRQPELERRHAAARRHLRCLRQWQDGVQGDAQQVPGGPGDHRIRGRAGIGRAEPDHAAANQTTQRTWADADRNFVPDCDLNNFAANGECGAVDNAATSAPYIPGTSYDPDLLTGLGKRAFNWEFTTSVQQELMPRMSIDVQYARRWYGNIRVMDDLSVTPASYTPFPFTAPSDSRLPDGGGYPLTGMALSPTAAPQSYFVTLSNNFGKQTEHFDGVNITLNARLQNGLLIQGGVGTGRQVLNDCEVVDDLPEMLHTFFGDPTRAFFFAARPREFCEQNNGFRTSVQGLAAYTIPKIDVQVSGTIQNLPGPVVQANANYGVIPGVAGFGPFIPFKAFQIVQPGELYVERLSQIDFRCLEDPPLRRRPGPT